MKIFASVIALLFGFYLWLRFSGRRKTTVEIDGCTIAVHQGVDIAWVVYREPSGGNITFDAHLDFRKPSRKISVEFPDTLTRADRSTEQVSGSQLGILDAPVSMTTPSEALADEVRDRISRGLTKLGIAHDFVPPSGWTSFEGGKQIYHGGPGVIRRDAQPK